MHAARLLGLFLLPTLAACGPNGGSQLAQGAGGNPWPPAAAFSQGFEGLDNSGWNIFGGQYDAIAVPSGTHGIASRTGAAHGEVGPFDLDNDGGSAFTRWGGYASVFPVGGYSTSVSVYLDLAAGAANDTRFDYSSAISGVDGLHRRDFVFNAGYYDDADVTGSGPRFVFSASTNAGRGGAFPKNPGKSPVAVTASGWYTLRHCFHDDGAGTLEVTLALLDPAGATVSTWSISDLSDIIGLTVGGNRYGWFASNELPFLAFDDTARFVPPEPGTCP